MFLSIGVAILLAIFISYGLSVIYEGPSSGCSGREDCRQSAEDRQQYRFNMFIILSILAAILIVIGFFISHLSVGAGVLGAGILVEIWAIISNWSSLHEYLRLGVIFLLLILLIGIGYWKIERVKKSDQRKQ